MLEFLSWLEASPLGETLRGFGVWTYGVLNLFHILGISTLFGSILVLDLRLLGLWRRIPIGMLARPTVPLAATGFTVAVASGICMISINATDYYGNPFMFYFKFPAIFLAALNVLLVRRMAAWRIARAGELALSSVQQRRLAVSGACSLTLWLVAVASGRMVGYW